NLPNHKDIAERGLFEQRLDLKLTIEKEESLFDEMVFSNDINGLLRRYPVRETPLLSKMASGLGLTRDKYESSVRKLIVDDKEAKEYLKKILNSLTTLIEGK
ncbi:MAG: hypothetical protein RIA63_09945, partial [Cyclobacteriaceae bacterium]